MKIGAIDVGGGMRGIYAAGILDTCMQQGIMFDYCIGISAGSANMASYFSGQLGRNYRFYHEYSFRKEYMGVENWLHKGSYINLQYIYGTLSNHDGEDPLDYRAFSQNQSELTIIASDAVTGEIKLFHKDDIKEDDYSILMASSCVPGVDKPVKIGDSFYFDGALADPVPIEQAFKDGCDRVVLILTKPADSIRKARKDQILAKLIQHKYPLAAENLRLRAERYNTGVQIAAEYAKQGKVLILSPDNTAGVDTLKRDKNALHTLYEKGLHDGNLVSGWLTQC